MLKSLPPIDKHAHLVIALREQPRNRLQDHTAGINHYNMHDADHPLLQRQRRDMMLIRH
jgi:hypothetical protein